MNQINVVDAKRFSKKSHDIVTRYNSILLTFSEPNLPDHVSMGYQKFTIRPYVPPPIRCFKCQRYGHVASECHGAIRCVRCGDHHSFDECPTKESPKCCHCQGNHSAAYGGCPEYKRAQKVVEIKTTQNISYSEAVKKVNPSKEQKPDPQKPEPETTHPKPTIEITKRGIHIEPMKFITFIIEIINNSFQTSTRSERIKVITKAAKRRLGIDLELESVLTDLNAPILNEDN